MNASENKMGENSADTVENEEPFALTMVLRLCFVAVFCVGLFGNLLVCIVVIQQRRMRTVINCFTLNLAISDLIIIVIYVPSQYAAYENNQNWPFGNVGCRITYSTVPVCLSASIGTLLAISCERFRGIVFPLQPRLRLRTTRRIILVIWMASITTALPLMIIAGTVEKGIEKGNYTFCDELWSNPNSSGYYWISMFLLQYVLPLAVMSVLYGLAGWKLQKRSRFLARNAEGREGSINHVAEIARQRQSEKITKMLVALVLIYSFCMLPQHVVYFWSTYGNLRDWKYYLYVFRIANVFTMANSALNPIVYGTLQTDFRKAYRLIFRKYNCCLCAEKENNSSLQEKPYDTITFRVKPAQKSTTEAPLGNKRKSSTMLQSDNDGALRTQQTLLKRRHSSSSHSPLISADSTSDSQNSKQSESNEKNTHSEQKIPELNGRKLKEIKSCNEEVRDSSSQIDAGTTFVKVFFSNKGRQNQTFANDSTNLKPESSLHKIKTDDIICLLDHAKETVL